MRIRRGRMRLGMRPRSGPSLSPRTPPWRYERKIKFKCVKVFYSFELSKINYGFVVRHLENSCSMIQLFCQPLQDANREVEMEAWSLSSSCWKNVFCARNSRDFASGNVYFRSNDIFCQLKHFTDENHLSAPIDCGSAGWWNNYFPIPPFEDFPQAPAELWM